MAVDYRDSWLARMSTYAREHIVGMAVFAILTTVAAQFIGERLNRLGTHTAPVTALPRAIATPVERPHASDDPAIKNSAARRPSSTSPMVPQERERGRATPRLRPTTTPVYINPSSIVSNEALLLVVDERFQSQPMLTSLLGHHLNANAGAFSDAFIRSGVMKRAYDGDFSDLSTVPEIDVVSLIFLGHARVTVSSNEQFMAGLLKTDLQISLRVYRPANGFSTQLLSTSAVGAGFSEADALANAVETIARQVKSLLR